VCATGPLYFSFLYRYAIIINISILSETAAETVEFVDVTGKLGGVNDQMKQLIKISWKAGV
jgi:hypothetical protein